MEQQFYQVGGSLPANAKSYIKRDADAKLYNYLKEGKYAYVLNARQVGKSSLRVHTSKRLTMDGYSCVNIDLTSIGSEDITADEWYFSFVYQIIEQLGLDEDVFVEWWESNRKLTTVNRFSKVFDKFILEENTQKIIIMIDEVDSILGIKKDFSANDFFAVIRTFYNLRSEDERYKNITFSLFGVATPEDLMRDSSRTPFNIAHSVKIEQFKFYESLSLIDGLENQQIDGREILEKIFYWTSGTPYLTQKILDYIVYNPIEKVEDIDRVVDILFIQENFKEINISNIQNRILSNEQYSVRMLYFIGKIISDTKVLADDGSLEEIYLKLSGLVKEEDGVLLYTNKIYQQLFNQTWLDESLTRIDRPFSTDLQRWIELNKTSSALLKGEVLIKAIEWASQSIDLTFDENEYLRLSIQEEQEQRLKEEKKRGESKLLKVLLGSLITFLFIGGGLVYFYLKNEEKSSLLQLATKNIDRRLDRIDMEAEIENSEDNHYEIPANLKTKIKIDLKLLKRFELIDNGIVNTSSSLVQLIIYTKKKRFDKQLWLNTVPSMSYRQKNKLFNILIYSAYIDEGEKYFQDNEDEKTISMYTKALKINPDNEDLYRSIGIAYIQGNKYEKAVEIYEKLIQSHPKDEALYKNLGDVYAHIPDYDNALYMYEKALKINSNNSELYSNKGNVYTLKNEYHKAIESYQKAIKMDSNNSSYYNSLGLVYEVLDNKNKAIKSYQKAIKLNPNEPIFYNNLAKIYILKNEYSKALRIYKKAIAMNSSDGLLYKKLVDYYQILTEDYISNKKYDKALDIYKELKEIDNSLIPDYNAILHVYKISKNYNDGIVYFKSRLKPKFRSVNNKNNKSDFNVYESLGDLYKLNNQYSDALIAYTEAIKINTKSNSVYYKIGTLYNINGKFKEAIKFYKKALEIKPNKEYFYALGLLYSLMGENDKAIEVYNRVIEIDSKKNNNLEKRIEKYAKSFLGTPYVWGATGADSFDSSGFTKWIYKDLGIDLPRVSREQAKVGQYIRYENLQIGDLVFFDTKKKMTGKVTHVGIYLNDGNFIHASSGNKKVVITNFNEKSFYKKKFLWGRRIIEENIDKKEENTNIYSNLADVYVANKKYDKAIKFYYKALDKKSSNHNLYLNFFEAQLIQGLNFDEKIEKEYIKKFGKKKEDMIIFDMLRILQHIANKQEVKIKILKWKKKYYNVKLNLNYVFDDLDAWVKTRNDKKILNIFKMHNKILKEKELYAKMKKKHIPFSKQGWVYLGEFEKGKWIKKYFSFNYDTNPLELVNTQQIMISPILSIREFGYATKIIGKLDKNDKVKILSVKSVSHMIENEGFMWANIQY